MNRHLLALTRLGLLSAVLVARLAAQQDSAFHGWAAKRTVPLSDSVLAFGQFDPLVGSARLIGVGERVNEAERAWLEARNEPDK